MNEKCVPVPKKYPYDRSNDSAHNSAHDRDTLLSNTTTCLDVAGDWAGALARLAASLFDLLPPPPDVWFRAQVWLWRRAYTRR